ncbi:MAG: hypothetical protein M1823_003609 [Watsoniomyces obsoletus]|nr:MAG: hypothetical protein M1823_003609 [Watsoniomyces obsoletus]
MLEKLKISEKILHKRSSSSCSTLPSPPPPYVASEPEVALRLDQLRLDDQVQEMKPSRDQCVAHLKLLKAFAGLRADVVHRDGVRRGGVFGITDIMATVAEKRSRQPRTRQAYLRDLEEKRWAVYVARATDRFEQWFFGPVKELVGGTTERLKMSDLDRDSSYDALHLASNPVVMTSDQLPPLDVLMVWHAYMLNPRDYLEDCMRYGMMRVWGMGMPWAAIDACIENVDFSYHPTEQAQHSFENSTNLSWDNLCDPLTKTLKCPACNSSSFTIPWTSCVFEKFQSSTNDDLVTLFATGYGYADANFRQTCSGCFVTIDPSRLRVTKFRRDLEDLLEKNYPMPGTVLNLVGTPTRASKRRPLERMATMFPNRLLLGGLGSQLLDQIRANKLDTSDPQVVKQQLDQKIVWPSISGVRSLLELEIWRKPLTVRKAKRSVFSTQLTREEKIAIRRMMSRYWENSSPFALDLSGAVIRQGVFVDKMNQIDWVHSPMLATTMNRLLIKYERFMQIMATHKNQHRMAVPTLDVDLAWHTHQHSPRQYYQYTVTKTGKFVDHNDKIAENKLSDGFEWTSKIYQKMYKEVYSQCTCPYCESVRESHRSPFPGTGTSTDAVQSRFYTSLPPQQPGSPKPDAPQSKIHISSHHAVSSPDVYLERLQSARRDKLKANYDRAFQRAVKHGHVDKLRSKNSIDLPACADDDGHYGHDGHDREDDWAPYAAASFLTVAYPVPPTSVSLLPGAPGNCVAGTCGGSVATGGCVGGCSAGAGSGGGMGVFADDGGGCGGGGCGGCGG